MPPSTATTRGRMAGTLVIWVAAAKASAAVSNRVMAFRLEMVGGIMVMSPARQRCRASIGRTHSLAITSRSSCSGVWLAGAAARKNRVS